VSWRSGGLATLTPQASAQESLASAALVALGAALDCPVGQLSRPQGWWRAGGEGDRARFYQVTPSS